MPAASLVRQSKGGRWRLACSASGGAWSASACEVSASGSVREEIGHTRFHGGIDSTAPLVSAGTAWPGTARLYHSAQRQQGRPAAASTTVVKAFAPHLGQFASIPRPQRAARAPRRGGLFVALCEASRVGRPPRTRGPHSHNVPQCGCGGAGERGAINDRRRPAGRAGAQHATQQRARGQRTPPSPVGRRGGRRDAERGHPRGQRRRIVIWCGVCGLSNSDGGGRARPISECQLHPSRARLCGTPRRYDARRAGLLARTRPPKPDA